jgi:prepilin-type N-terminal cleavage/methylation domain-containing protein
VELKGSKVNKVNKGKKNKGKGGVKMKGRRGFTLIELLVVLSILGVLIALAVPRFAGLAADRNLQVCQANLRTLDSSIAIYRIEEADWPDDISDVADNSTAYIQAIPDCPGGGTYILASDSESSTCDVSTHTLPSQ